MATLWKILTRKKVIDPVRAEETNLARILNTFDLTALGVGSTLGVGVYVLAGHVAKDTAGPAVVLSFLIAALASVFAGLCYAELGARAPRAGSAYVYSYVCVGEFVAFVIGWNLILEYVIGSASVARGLSSYIDSLVNNSMQNAFMDVAPINVPFLSKYFDFFSFSISVLLAVALAFGLKESSLTNNIFTVLNIFVVLFVVIAGSITSNTSNWAIPGNSSDPAFGEGGFFPFGIEGVIKGAATCFYGFVGFDCIATTGEEVKNPKKAIPISIILSLFIIFLAYFGTSTVITLMVPYYRQNPDAPIPFAFEDVGWIWAKWVVSIGGIFGLCASLFGAMFPLPRVIYAMANDGVIFKFLGKVHPRFKTPVIGTIVAGVFTGLMSAMFELKQLVNMMSIGTLLAYSIVAASVMLLRYTNDNLTEGGGTSHENSNLLSDESTSGVLTQIFNCGRLTNPTETSEKIVAVEIFLYCVTCVLIGLCAIYLRAEISDGQVWAIVLTSLTVFFAVILIMSLVTQPTSKKEVSFKVPMVPLIPALSILINVYLMLMLDTQTWIRFAVWMILGFLLYFICLRLYACAELRTLSLKSTDTEGVNGLKNGHVRNHENKGFEDESDKSLDGTQRIQNVPQSPDTVDRIENILLEKELQKLDKMLDEEGRKLSNNSVIRKLSIDTVSVASSVVMHEESVVAVVHRDNVDIPAEPNSPFLYSNQPYVVQLVNTSNETLISENSTDCNDVPTNDKNQTFNSDLEAILSEQDYNFINQNNCSEGSVDSGIHNSESYESKEWEEKVDSVDTMIYGTEISEIDFNMRISCEESALDVTEAPSSTTKEDCNIVSDITKSSPEGGKIENSDTSIISNAMEVTAESDIKPPPPPPPPPLILEIKSAPVRPTSENLSSITLRKVEARPKTETGLNVLSEEDNLRVNSEKTKQFKNALSEKLSNSLAYIPVIYPQKHAQVGTFVKTENKVNENVVEDSINTKEAKDKLSVFLNSLLEPSQNGTQQMHHQEKGTHDKIIQKHDGAKVEDNKDEELEHKEDDFNEHKRRMLTVFRSMTLKNTEALNLIPERSRNVKTVGPLNDDRTRHRQAMSDIFKTIEMRRKDSAILDQ